MSNWIADQIILKMIKKNIDVRNSNVLILGFSFKENCADIRNTKVIDLYKALKIYNLNCSIVDPIIDIKKAENFYNVKILAMYFKRKFLCNNCCGCHEFQKISTANWKN